MISYEEARDIAIAQAKAVGLEVNRVRELPRAYIFDDAHHQYDGLLPMVVQKTDGRVLNYWQYIMRNNIKGKDIKEIPF